MSVGGDRGRGGQVPRRQRPDILFATLHPHLYQLLHPLTRSKDMEWKHVPHRRNASPTQPTASPRASSPHTAT